jgi:predicted NUDIX family phosphoesterase
MAELVMAVPQTYLDPFLAPHPFDLVRANADRVIERILSQHIYIDRDFAETCFEYRQVIPYVMIRNGDLVYSLRRTTRQREFRLHHKLSLGIGGHINPDDARHPEGALMGGLLKELTEEVHVDAVSGDLEFIGLINDLSTDVSRVHLGLLYVFHTECDVSVRETEKMTGEWIGVNALSTLTDAMESWSKIVFDQYVLRESRSWNVSLA